MYPNDSDKPPRKPRVSKTVPMAHVTIRVPIDVFEWFQTHAGRPTTAMRYVLVDFVNKKRS